MKYLKLFNSENEYIAFKETSDFITPNVSFAKEENKIFYNPKMPEYVTFTIRQEGYEESGQIEIPNTTVTVPKGTTFAEFVNDYEHYLNTDCMYLYIGDTPWQDYEYLDRFGEEIADRVIQNGDHFSFIAC